jgi:hypothetical protein
LFFVAMAPVAVTLEQWLYLINKINPSLIRL